MFRLLGVLFVLGGLALVVHGGFAIADASPSNEEFFAGETSGPGVAEIGQLVAGMFLLIIGLGCLNAGFLGAQADYAANETSGAVRTLGSVFRGDDAEPQERGRSADNKFCSECGHRNDRAAKFCDDCGYGIG